MADSNDTGGNDAGANEARANARKVREGLAVSVKMDKTVVVAVVDRVRHARDYLGRRRHAVRSVLRADDSVQSPHQVLRGRPPRVLPRYGDAEADAARSPFHDERRES